MFPYLFILLLITILYFQKDTTFENNKGGYYFFLIVFILIVGFRDMIGGFDVYIYGEVYEAPLDFLVSFPHFEKGFIQYFHFLRNFSENRYFMFFVTAAVTTGLHFKSIKKLSPLVFFSLFIYFSKLFLMSFVYLRQFIAMGIIWLAIPLIREKKYWKALIFPILAFFFHKSSLVFLPFLFLAHIKLSNKQMIFLLLGFCVIFFSPVGSVVVTNLADDSGNDKLQMYAEQESGFNIFYFFEASILTLLVYKFKKYFYEYKLLVPILNGMIAYILFAIIGITNPTFVRLSWYYIIFLVIALPYMYVFIKDAKQKQLFKIIVFVYFASLFVRLLILYDGGDFLPYKAFFEDFERNGVWEYMEYR